MTVANIVAFSQQSPSGVLKFDLPNIKMTWLKKKQKQYVHIFKPKYGQQFQILYSTGYLLYSLHQYEAAVESYRNAVEIDPKSAKTYYNLGSCFYAQGWKGKKRAIEMYRKFLELSKKEKGDCLIDQAEKRIAELENK